MENIEGYALKYRTAIWGRLMAECAPDLSDETITRILEPCVAGQMLVPAAKWLRDHDMIELREDVPYARGETDPVREAAAPYAFPGRRFSPHS